MASAKVVKSEPQEDVRTIKDIKTGEVFRTSGHQVWLRGEAEDSVSGATGISDGLAGLFLDDSAFGNGEKFTIIGSFNGGKIVENTPPEPQVEKVILEMTEAEAVAVRTVFGKITTSTAVAMGIDRKTIDDIYFGLKDAGVGYNQNNVALRAWDWVKDIPASV